MNGKWPRLAAKSRRGTVEALTHVTLLMTTGTRRGRPADAVLREALYVYALNPRRWSEETVGDARCGIGLAGARVAARH
jgi:hypothetical protein